MRLGRDTTLSVAAGLPVFRGTIALATASLAALEAGQDGARAERMVKNYSTR